MAGKTVKRRGAKFNDIPGLDAELDSVTGQVPHKDEVIYKGDIPKTLLVECYVANTSGGTVDKKLTIQISNYQLSITKT